jgi:hypothetical protein
MEAMAEGRERPYGNSRSIAAARRVRENEISNPLLHPVSRSVFFVEGLEAIRGTVLPGSLYIDEAAEVG